MNKLIFTLLAAVIISIAGLFSRVTALEVRQPTIEENLKVIREDVREIRNWIVPKAPPGAR